MYSLGIMTARIGWLINHISPPPQHTAFFLKCNVAAQIDAPKLKIGSWMIRWNGLEAMVQFARIPINPVTLARASAGVNFMAE